VAPGLKTIDDATGIRRRILLAFEQAEQGSDPEARQRLLTFVVIGGGPTGVEMAGAIAELAHVALRRDFRTINPREARIVLVEAGPRLLPAFPAALSEAAHRSLERLHVEVRLGKPVSHCDEAGVIIGEERLEAATLVWAAGVASSPAAQWLEVDKDRLGRVMVGPDLTVPGHSEIFVIGDTAHALGRDGQPLPGLAPVAKQQGAYVARVLRARLAGKSPPAPFRYRNYGAMATIGRRAAVADFGWLKLDGTLAWLMWGLVHVSFLIGFRNRVVVMLDWIWSYVTFQSGARLITGPPDSH
jgi:NADH dehydrogenase